MMLASVLATALRFRVLLLSLSLALLIVGGLSLRRMPVDVTGELGSGPVLEVQTEALGLSSQEVEQYVTVPLENNLLDGVMGVWDVRSESVAGLSVVNLYFEPGVTTLHARQLVQERLTNAFSLPNVSQPPQLIQPLSSDSRAVLIGLNGSKAVPPLELSYLARWVVKPRLSGVPGVANVAIFGQRDRQLQVLVDPRRMTAAHVTLSQVIQTTGNAQLVSPLTYLEGSSPGTGGFLEGPNQRLDIRPVLPLGQPRDLAAVPISDAPGRPKIGSVAHVVLGNQPLIGDALTHRGGGLVLLVQKLPGASLRGVTNGVLAALRDLAPALHGVSVDTNLYRPATYVSDSLSHLLLIGAVAAGLLALALLAVLFDAAAAGITLGVSAVALVVAALVLDLLGYSLNAFSALGLLGGSAVVIDDALSGTQAALTALRRRALADQAPALTVLNALAPLRSAFGYATALVLLCAVPAFVAHGAAARLVHPMLLAFALAVLSSMVVALSIAPALSLLVLGARRPRVHPMAAHASAALQRTYSRMLHGASALPRPVPVALCIVGLVGLGALPFLHEPAPPQFNQRNLVVSWQGPIGASLAKMDQVTAHTQRALAALPGVADVGATLGRAVTGDRTAEPSSGQIYVTAAPGADLDRVRTAVQATVSSVPGMHATVGDPTDELLSGVLSPASREVTVRVYGQDFNVLNQLGSRLTSQLAGDADLGQARVVPQRQEPNIEVRVNDTAALRAGVLPGDARRQASTLVSGLTVGNFFQDQAVFDVVVRGGLAVHSTVADVRELPIDTSGGRHVRLGDIANVSVRPDPVDIQHQALARYVDVQAPVVNGTTTEAQSHVRELLGGVSFPLDYHAEVMGGTPEDPTSHVTFLTYELAAAIGVLLLLQAAVGSWRLAALFFLALPLSLAGGLIAAAAIGQLASIGTDMGLLVVFAFAVRQGLPLLSSLRRLQLNDRASPDAALVRAVAAQRIGPALGSALAVAVVMLPFVFVGNDVAGNELPYAAAAVILGGLVSATLLNVLALPALCVAFGWSEPPSIDETLDEITAEHALTITAGARGQDPR